MKKLLLASLLVGSMASATTNEQDTRSVAMLTASEPCDMPVDCSSLSPLARSVCILKGLGQFGFGAFCLASCYLGGRIIMKSDTAGPWTKFSRGILTSAVTIVLAAEAGRCCKDSILDAIS